MTGAKDNMISKIKCPTTSTSKKCKQYLHLQIRLLYLLFSAIVRQPHTYDIPWAPLRHVCGANMAVATDSDDVIILSGT